MDTSSFLSGNYLTHVDLTAPSHISTVSDVKQQLVGTDQKICVFFNEHQKPLGLNKTNLRTIVQAYGVHSENWIGKPLELYKDQCDFQGRPTDCIRLRIPPQGATVPQGNVAGAQTPVPTQQQAVPPTPPAAPAAPPAATPPVPPQQPVAPPQQEAQGGQQAPADAPWE